MKTQLLLSSLLLIATACSSGNKADQGSEATNEGEAQGNEVVISQKQLDAIGITFTPIEQRDLSSSMLVNGETALYPHDMAEVTPLTGGVLRSLLVREGSNVSKGQVVGYIENTEIISLQKDYLQSIAELSLAERELTRQQELQAEGAGIAKNLQNAETVYSVAKAAADGLANQLQLYGVAPSSIKNGKFATQIPLKAPISGFVGKIFKNSGSYVDVQQPVMSILDNAKLHIDINVYEKDMPYLKIGQKVEFVMTNNPNQKLTGEIYEYDSSFNGTAKTIAAHVKILSKSDNSMELIPGMYVTGSVMTGMQTVDAVPSEAVVTSDGKQYIFVLKNEEKGEDGTNYVFERVEVTTGIEELGYTEIKPLVPIAPDAKIVAKSAFYLSSMMGDSGED